VNWDNWYSFWDSDTQKKLIAYDDTTYETVGYVGAALGGLMFLFATPYTIFLYRTKSNFGQVAALAMTEETGKVVPIPAAVAPVVAAQPLVPAQPPPALPFVQ
jgi:hypothetical protein